MALLMGGVVFLVLLSGEFSSGSQYHVITSLSDPKDIIPFQMTDQEGQPFGSDELQGHWTLLFFGFTNCPDICPPTMYKLTDFVKQVGDDAPRVVMVSVDPERDSPAMLKRYVKGFHEDFMGIVGPESELVPLAKDLGIYVEKSPMAQDEHSQHANHGQEMEGSIPAYTINHAGSVLMVDPNGDFAGVMSPPLDARAMAKAWPGFMRKSGI